jgi:hypothetical protein
MSALIFIEVVLPGHAQPNHSGDPGRQSVTKVQPTKPSPIDPSLAKRNFDLARRLAQADGGALWGKSLAGPMLFVEPRSRFVVANQAGPQHLLKPADSVFVGTLPSNLPLANTAIDWGGTRWSMMLWPLPEDNATQSVMLMHESWHRIQHELGLPSKDPVNAQLDTLGGRYWLQLEWRALAKALASSGTDQRKAIEDACQFRRHRRELFKGSAVAENMLELHEGLAEYTGIKLSGLSAAAQTRLLIEHFEKYPTEFPTFVRSFAYLSGPGYGLLLDQYAPGWARNIKPGDDLGQQLATALDLKLPPQAEASLKARALRYDGAQLWSGETAREEARVKKVAAFRQLLVDGPVLVVPLSKQQMSFNPSQIVPIEGIGTVYPTLTLMAPWGKLQVRKASLIAANFKKAAVAAPFKSEASKLSGDGWELLLEPGWKAVPGERKGDWILKKEG